MHAEGLCYACYTWRPFKTGSGLAELFSLKGCTGKKVTPIVVFPTPPLKLNTL